MTLANTLPFGLRDVKLQSISAAGVVSSTLVDLPVARTLAFSETENFEELRGDDKLAAEHGDGPVIEWTLEGGGISLEAYAILAGGTVTSSGTTPDQVKTFSKLVTDARPYFAITGQAISDNGGDMHGVIYKAKASGALDGKMEQGSFFLSGASGKGYGNETDHLYDFVQHEAVTAITAVT